LCGWFQKLGNWCLVGKTSDFMVEVGVGYLALFLVELAGCSVWDMLFAGGRRIGDCWLGCMDLTCMWGVVVWLVIW
jgi:hypothetical protein